MLKIRLARGGAKKRPFYRIVVADARAPRDGRFIEKLGIYNPLIAKNAELSAAEKKAGRARLKIDLERIQFWLKNGAQPTERVMRFLEDADLLSPRQRNNPNKAKPKAKAQARAAAEAEAAEAEKAQAETETDAKAETAKAAEAEEKSDSATDSTADSTADSAPKSSNKTDDAKAE